MTNQATTAAEHATVIFDGACGFCRKQVKDMQALDSEQQLQFLPRQSADAESRFPQIKSNKLGEGILLIDQQGNVYKAADAIDQIFHRLPSRRWFCFLYRLPVIKQIIQLGYKFIAANSSLPWADLRRRRL